MKTYTAEVTVRLKIAANSEDDVRYALQEMDYSFDFIQDRAEITSSEITDQLIRTNSV